MTKNIFIGEVSLNEEIQIDHFLMKVMLPLSFTEPLPGQFVMIRIAGLRDPFLSRPLSIYAYKRSKSNCVIELLYRVAGRGTQILAGLIKGSQVEISGPLGKSYSVDHKKKNIVFIAGGIGVAPLTLLADHLCKKACHRKDAMTFYMGAKTEAAMVGLDRIRKLCYDIIVCTDDGSLGKKSLVTQAFQKNIKKYLPSNTDIYACGSKAMVKELSRITNGKYFCQVSLEERMACGVGACVGCAVAVKDAQGKPDYKRVCADGPVFDLQQILWE